MEAFFSPFHAAELAAKIYSANPSITAFGQHLHSDILLHVLYMHVNRWHIHLVFKTFQVHFTSIILSVTAQIQR